MQSRDAGADRRQFLSMGRWSGVSVHTQSEAQSQGPSTSQGFWHQVIARRSGKGVMFLSTGFVNLRASRCVAWGSPVYAVRLTLRGNWPELGRTWRRRKNKSGSGVLARLAQWIEHQAADWLLGSISVKGTCQGWRLHPQ